MMGWEKRVFHLSVALVAVSGFAYLVMKYAMETDDPLALVNHPLQPYTLDLHLLASPLLLFVGGMLVRAHIRPKLRKAERNNRRSGLITLWMLLAMGLSGYLLQIVTAPLLHRICLVLHLVSGTLFSLFYLGHVIVSLRSRNSPSVRKQANSRERLAA